MTYKGVVKGNVIELEGEAALPEGTRGSVIPEQPAKVNILRGINITRRRIWDSESEDLYEL